MTTAPYFLDGHRVMLHDSMWTYIIDFQQCHIESKFEGVPVAIDEDHQMIFIINDRPSLDVKSIFAVDIKSGEKIDQSKLGNIEFLSEPPLIFNKFNLSVGEKPKMVMHTIFDPSDVLDIFVYNKPFTWESGLHLNQELFQALSAPIVAFTGWTDYDADDYGFFELFNMNTQKSLLQDSLWAGAPLLLNHKSGSNKLSITASDYVYSVDILSGESETIIEGQPSNRFYTWKGPARLHDSIIISENSDLVIIAEKFNWYFMNKDGNGNWNKGTLHSSNSEIRRLSYSDEKVLLQTVDDVQILTEQGALECKISL